MGEVNTYPEGYFEELVKAVIDTFGTFNGDFATYLSEDYEFGMHLANKYTIPEYERAQKIKKIAEYLAPMAHEKWYELYKATCPNVPAYKKGRKISCHWDELEEADKSANIEDLFLTITLVIEPLIRNGTIDPAKELTEEQKRLLGMVEHVKWSDSAKTNFEEIYKICADKDLSIDTKIYRISAYHSTQNPLQGKNLFLFRKEYEDIDSIETISTAIENPIHEVQEGEEINDEKAVQVTKADAARIHAFLTLDKLFQQSSNGTEEEKELAEKLKKIETEEVDNERVNKTTIRLHLDKESGEENPERLTLRAFSKMSTETIDKYLKAVFEIMKENELFRTKFEEILNSSVKQDFSKIIEGIQEKSNIGFTTVVDVEQKKDHKKTVPILRIIDRAIQKDEGTITDILVFLSHKIRNPKSKLISKEMISEKKEKVPKRINVYGDTSMTPKKNSIHEILSKIPILSRLIKFIYRKRNKSNEVTEETNTKGFDGVNKWRKKEIKVPDNTSHQSKYCQQFQINRRKRQNKKKINNT